MNTDGKNLDELIKKLEILLPLTREVASNLQTVKELSVNLPSDIAHDKFVLANVACEILGINHNKLGRLVKEGFITPYYIASNQRRFRLSELYALAKPQPWVLEDADDIHNK